MPHEPRRKGGQAWGRIARFLRRKSSAPSPDVHSRRRVPRARQHFRRRSWHTRGGVWYRQTIVGIAAGLHLGLRLHLVPDANAAERIVDVVDSNAAMRRSLAEAGLLRQNTVPFAVKRASISQICTLLLAGCLLHEVGTPGMDGLDRAPGATHRLRMGDRLSEGSPS